VARRQSKSSLHLHYREATIALTDFASRSLPVKVHLKKNSLFFTVEFHDFQSKHSATVTCVSSKDYHSKAFFFFYDLVTSLRFPEPAQLGITTKSLCLKPWFSYYPVTSLRFLEPTQLEITIKSLYLKLRYHYSESQHKNSRLLITERHNKLCCLYPVGGGFF
jgi:hypothetical protein